MSGETGEVTSGWTTDTLKSLSDERERHREMLRAADQRLADERARNEERLALEREKALKIKEQGDRDALQLAREIQTYKDEKANELREQINRERGHYASKEDLIALSRELRAELKPVSNYVSSQQGRSRGLGDVVGWVFGAVGMVATIIVVVLALSK